jgi:hypothetical protein
MREVTLSLGYRITPHPSRAPELPAGCVFKSSVCSWKMIDLPTTEVGPGLTVTRSSTISSCPFPSCPISMLPRSPL